MYACVRACMGTKYLSEGYLQSRDQAFNALEPKLLGRVEMLAQELLKVVSGEEVGVDFLSFLRDRSMRCKGQTQRLKLARDGWVSKTGIVQSTCRGRHPKRWCVPLPRRVTNKKLKPWQKNSDMAVVASIPAQSCPEAIAHAQGPQCVRTPLQRTSCNIFACTCESNFMHRPQQQKHRLLHCPDSLAWLMHQNGLHPAIVAMGKFAKLHLLNQLSR